MSKFIEVKCQCESTQIIFSKPSGEVKCNACSTVLAYPTGGIGDIKAKIVRELD